MTIAFRADASTQIGVGHVMRCLTLANAIQKRGVQTIFVCRHLPQYLESILTSSGHQVLRLNRAANGDPPDDLSQSKLLGVSQHQDATETIAAIANTKLDWIVVDHYGMDARWETSLRAMASRIMVIDDTADRMHDCDVLLDQNFYLKADTRYVGKVPPACALLLGPRYALLRDEFRVWRTKTKPRTGPVKRILVFLGGMDAENHTGRTIEILSQICGTKIAIDVVIGAEHSKREQIESLCMQRQFRCHVETSHMAELMANADFCIGAGGSATWERMALGLPTLTKCIAQNQRQLIEDCAKNGFLIAAGSMFEDELTAATKICAILAQEELLVTISKKCMELVDERGTLRVLRALNCTGIQMRPATNGDSARIFEWRNHPSIRNFSLNSKEISKTTHEQWLASILADRDRILLIGTRNQIEVGVVRFDIQHNEAEVSIYLCPSPPEPGLGSDLLQSAEQYLRNFRPTTTRIHAQVLDTNEPSKRLFLGMNYEWSGIKFTKVLR
jgi:UDP-2,4-diacetamido-2,4,6-trideoxy-beta-L-altropyranose hydrolase